MVDLKRFRAPRAFSPVEFAIGMVVACVLGSIIGAQGALYEVRKKERQEMSAKVQSKAKNLRAQQAYAFSEDSEAPDRAQDAAKKFTRRIGP